MTILRFINRPLLDVASEFAAQALDMTVADVEDALARGGMARTHIFDALASHSITFAYASPLNWAVVSEEVAGYASIYDHDPDLITFDQ